MAREEGALERTDTFKNPEASLLRYRLVVECWAAGQTMAVGGLRAFLRRYGRETLVLALRCVTQTCNNVPGMLSARVVEALCKALALVDRKDVADYCLIRALDPIDLDALQRASLESATSNDKGQMRSLAEDIVARLSRELRRDAA